MNTPLCRDRRRLMDVLVIVAGNITYAAEMLAVSKRYLMTVVKYQGLNDYARKLRRLAGAPAVGRPRGSGVDITISK